MTVRVGLIGTGLIGADHARNLARRVAGGTVATVYDVDAARAAALAAEVGARAVTSEEEVIATADAVVIASPAHVHAATAVACIAAAKPTLCEKPLATAPEDAFAVVRAEVEHGARLVQVGFMRRFDPGYVAVRDTLVNGTIGPPVLAHMTHRNLDVPADFTDELLVRDSLVHEVDIARWLFDDEVAAVRVLVSRSRPGDLTDPLVLVLELTSGLLVIAEVSARSGFGYDVRCEVVGSSGTAEVTTPRVAQHTLAGARAEPIAQGWLERFGDTYRVELQAWIDAVASGRSTGASAWDGYAAAVIADAGVQALHRPGDRVPVTLPERPALYA